MNIILIKEVDHEILSFLCKHLYKRLTLEMFIKSKISPYKLLTPGEYWSLSVNRRLSKLWMAENNQSSYFSRYKLCSESTETEVIFIKTEILTHNHSFEFSVHKMKILSVASN